MSTMQVLATGVRAARQAAQERRTARSGLRTRTHRLGAVLAEHGLALGGLTCFTVAAAMVAVPLGLVVAGVSLFILELRAGE